MENSGTDSWHGYLRFRWRADGSIPGPDDLSGTDLYVYRHVFAHDAPTLARELDREAERLAGWGAVLAFVVAAPVLARVWAKGRSSA